MTPPRHPLAFGAPSPWAAAWGEDEFGPFEVLRVGKVKYRMRWIPPGTSEMGSDDEKGRFDDEGPRHTVHLTGGFWLGETPCTQALWAAVMENEPSRFKGVARPVEQVSWKDCQAFFAKLEAHAPGDEVEVLFTLMAERYERRSLVITSNLVFGEWDRIFKNPMTTAAAIDRLVHHSAILEFSGSSKRADEAELRSKSSPTQPSS